MIVIPESSARFVIRSETLAENFLLKQFLTAWQNDTASISMDVPFEQGHLRLEISNQSPKALPAGELLESKIKRLFL